MTNVTNAVTGERATSSLMGHMNTLMGGMVMTARNTDSVTEDIAHSPAITLAPLLFLFFSKNSEEGMSHVGAVFNDGVAV